MLLLDPCQRFPHDQTTRPPAGVTKANLKWVFLYWAPGFSFALGKGMAFYFGGLRCFRGICSSLYLSHFFGLDLLTASASEI